MLWQRQYNDTEAVTKNSKNKRQAFTIVQNLSRPFQIGAYLQIMKVLLCSNYKCSAFSCSNYKKYS